MNYALFHWVVTRSFRAKGMTDWVPAGQIEELLPVQDNVVSRTRLAAVARGDADGAAA